MAAEPNVKSTPFAGATAPDVWAKCKGSWRIGTACGDCIACQAEARRLIPLLLADNFQMREVLIGLHDELVGSGKLVSNPKLTARAIGAVIVDTSSGVS
jgi:hypothetical protein